MKKLVLKGLALSLIILVSGTSQQALALDGNPGGADLSLPTIEITASSPTYAQFNFTPGELQVTNNIGVGSVPHAVVTPASAVRAGAALTITSFLGKYGKTFGSKGFFALTDVDYPIFTIYVQSAANPTYSEAGYTLQVWGNAEYGTGYYSVAYNGTVIASGTYK